MPTTASLMSFASWAMRAASTLEVSAMAILQPELVWVIFQVRW